MTTAPTAAPIDTIKEAIAIGAARGFTPTAVRLPLETIKTVQQAEDLSVAQAAKRVFQARGLRGFYPDVIANAGRTVIKQSYRYPALAALPHFAREVVGQDNHADLVLTGAVIGVLEGGLIGPLDRIKNATMTSHGKISYMEFIKWVLAQKKPWQQAYRGVASDLFRRTVSWSTFLVSNRVFSRMEQSRTGEQGLSMSSLALVTGEVAVVSTVINTPLDTVRTKVQAIGSKNTSFATTFSDVLKKTGPLGFYRGWQVNLYRYSIHAAFSVPILAYLERTLWAAKDD